MSFQDSLAGGPSPNGYFCQACSAIFASIQDFQSHFSSHHTYAIQPSVSMAMYSALTQKSAPTSSVAMQSFNSYSGSQFTNGPLSGMQGGYSQFQPADTTASDNLLCLSQVAVHQLATQSLQEMLAKRSSTQVGGGQQQQSVISVGGDFAAASGGGMASHSGIQQQQSVISMGGGGFAVGTGGGMASHGGSQQQQQASLSLYSLPTHLYGQQPSATVTPVRAVYSSAALYAPIFSHASPVSGSGSPLASCAPSPGGLVVVKGVVPSQSSATSTSTSSGTRMALSSSAAFGKTPAAVSMESSEGRVCDSFATRSLSSVNTLARNGSHPEDASGSCGVKSRVDILAEATKHVLAIGDCPVVMMERGSSCCVGSGDAGFDSNDSRVDTGMVTTTMLLHMPAGGEQLNSGAPITVRSVMGPAIEEHLDELTGVRTQTRIDGTRVALSFALNMSEKFAKIFDMVLPGLVFKCKQCEHVSGDFDDIVCHISDRHAAADSSLADGLGSVQASAGINGNMDENNLATVDRGNKERSDGSRTMEVKKLTAGVKNSGRLAKKQHARKVPSCATLEVVKVALPADGGAAFVAEDAPLEVELECAPLEREYECAKCGETLYSLKRYTAHRRQCIKVRRRGRPKCKVLRIKCPTTACGRTVALGQHEAYKLCHQVTGDSGHSFACYVCSRQSESGSDKVFASWQPCMEHLLSEHEEARAVLACFQCDSCGEVTKSRLKLNKHAHAQHHASFPDWKCFTCSAQSFSQEHFDGHLRCCRGDRERGNRTSTSGAVSAADPALRSLSASVGAPPTDDHSRRHVSMLSCTGCGKKFLHKSRLQRHLLTNACSLSVTRTYQCQYCNKSFARKSMLVNHQIWCLYQSKGGNPEPLKFANPDEMESEPKAESTDCVADNNAAGDGGNSEECDSGVAKCSPAVVAFPVAAVATVAQTVVIAASGRPGRKRSSVEFGGGSEQRFKCSQTNCFTVLSGAVELAVHRQCHTKENHELQCYKCNFAPSHNRWFPLKEHFIAMHPGTLEAKFKCVTCGKGFAKQKKYSEHIKIHSEDKTYQCNECSMSFKQQCSLRHHVISAHVDPSLKEAASEIAMKKKSTEEKKAHLCYICGYSTDSGSYFTTHMNIHKGVKPYSCQFCSYESVDRACYKRHMWRHKDEKPYKCFLCPYAGIQKAQLVAHMKTKHITAIGDASLLNSPTAGADGIESEAPAVRQRSRRGGSEAASSGIHSISLADGVGLVLPPGSSSHILLHSLESGGHQQHQLSSAAQMTHHLMNLPLPDYLSSLYGSSAAAPPNGSNLHALLL